MFRHALVFSLLTLLAGCAGLTSRESVEGQGDAKLWQAHKAQVAALDGWQISGKVGIRAPRDSGSGTLFWLQRQDYFDIRLSGPLGRGAARLTGREGNVLLEVANQGRYEAESPEALLEEQLGWRLPVSHLFWWVRGLPALRILLSNLGVLVLPGQLAVPLAHEAFADDGSLRDARLEKTLGEVVGALLTAFKPA